MDASYITSALKPEQLPPFDLPEVAMIGRSNCGKSSLINTLLGRQNLARHSRVPGRTQMINFFSVDNRVIFADLPGYGFSAINKGMRAHWTSLVDAYWKRPNIQFFLLLIDCRRELNEEDLGLLHSLYATQRLHLVLTKTDKLSRLALQKHLEKIQHELKSQGIDLTTIHCVSSLKKTGIEALRELILPSAVVS